MAIPAHRLRDLTEVSQLSQIHLLSPPTQTREVAKGDRADCLRSLVCEKG